MATACGNPSWNTSEFEKAVGLALSKLNVGEIRSLTIHQSRSVDCFLSGNDTFVTLPTGRGKSLVYQICPAVATELSSLGHKFPDTPIMVVISPLNSLIQDQITSCKRTGIKACKVEVENSTSLLEVCDYNILFASQRYLKIHWWQNDSRNTVTVSSELLLTSHIVLYSGGFFVNCCKPTFVFSDSWKDLSYSTLSCM